MDCDGLKPVRCSYFWITRLDVYRKTGCMAADELRRDDILCTYPTFRGVDDMEGHFEFDMTPANAIKHMEALGIVNDDKADAADLGI